MNTIMKCMFGMLFRMVVVVGIIVVSRMTTTSMFYLMILLCFISFHHPHDH
jgi:hypothetical protein